MPITVGTDAYVDIEEAEQYFEGRLYIDAWTNATEEDKEIALKQATRTIDRLPLKGRPICLEQPLAFPRSYFAEGIPRNVKYACCEEALALLEYGNSERLRLQKEGVTSFSIGNLSESYKVSSGIVKELHSEEAKGLLRPYIAGSVVIV